MVIINVNFINDNINVNFLNAVINEIYINAVINAVIHAVINDITYVLTYLLTYNLRILSDNQHRNSFANTNTLDTINGPIYVAINGIN
jgi:hypothetical protein